MTRACVPPRHLRKSPASHAIPVVSRPGSYKTTALPIELGRRGFPNDSRITGVNIDVESRGPENT